MAMTVRELKQALEMYTDEDDNDLPVMLSVRSSEFGGPVVDYEVEMAEVLQAPSDPSNCAFHITAEWGQGKDR